LKKIWIYVLLVCFLFVSINPGQVLAASSFKDIDKNWAKTSILRLSSLGYLSGYPDGKFKPDNSITRAEFTSALMACLGITSGDTTTASFVDIKKHWAQARINEAVKRGILVASEYPNGLKPDGAIKRSEVAAMLVRALGKEADNGAVPPFEDKAAVEKSMYKGYIKAAFDLGLMSGYPGGKFDPLGNMTRAQVCSVLSGFLDKKGGTLPSATTTLPAVTSGGITTVAIGDELFKLGTNPIIFRKGLTDIAVTSLSASTGYVVVNGTYPYKLDAGTDNPDIVANNLRYKVNRLSINGDKLLAYPGSSSINSVTVADHKYGADYVKLYINSANSNNYLADMQLLDDLTVKINNQTYTLNKDKITLELGSDFYDVKRVNFNTTETKLELLLTDPVIKAGLSLADFSAIFSGSTSLNLNSIRSIEFIVDGSRYKLSALTVDASGNFTLNQKTYAPSKVVMLIDGMTYKINNVTLNNKKFIFYCSETTANSWIVINDVYRDVKDVKFLKDNVIYDVDQVMVISLNVIRIGSKQYNLDSTLKCRFDNKIYNITRIDFDASLQADVLKVDQSTTDSYLSNQPVKYIFYRNSSKYLEGLNDTVLIKAAGSWISFSKVLVPDPAHFTYSNSSYDLIGAQLRIDQSDFIVTDTKWSGRTQLMEIYLN